MWETSKSISLLLCYLACKVIFYTPTIVMQTVYSDTLHWDAGEVLEAGKDSKQEIFGPKFTLTFRCVTCLTLRGLSIEFCISFPDFIYGTRWTRWTRCPAWPSQVGSRYLERLERAGENLPPLWSQSVKSSHRDFPKSFLVIDSVLHIALQLYTCILHISSLRKNMFLFFSEEDTVSLSAPPRTVPTRFTVAAFARRRAIRVAESLGTEITWHHFPPSSTSLNLIVEIVTVVSLKRCSRTTVFYV